MRMAFRLIVTVFFAVGSPIQSLALGSSKTTIEMYSLSGKACQVVIANATKEKVVFSLQFGNTEKAWHSLSAKDSPGVYRSKVHDCSGKNDPMIIVEIITKNGMHNGKRVRRIIMPRSLANRGRYYINYRRSRGNRFLDIWKPKNPRKSR